MDSDNRLKFTLNVAMVSGIFCVTVALLLMLNFIQMAKNKPLESKALIALVKQLAKEPENNELKQEIRNFDLLARKAYFNSQWQVRTGGYLLLFGAILFAVALRYFYDLKSKIGEPLIREEDDLTSRIMTQRWVLITGSILIVLGLGSSFAAVDHLKKYDVNESLTAIAPDENIEVIAVGAQPQVVKSIKNDSVTKVQKAIVQNPVKDTVAKTAPSVNANSSVALSAKAVTTRGSIKTSVPNFRGPYGQGVYFQKNTPLDWDATLGKNVIWKTTLPKKGFNSPVIWGGKLFLSGADLQSREVYCFDSKTGKLIWTQKVDKVPGSPAAAPKVTEDTGLAAPTLTTDGNKVFALFANGDMVCLDTEGKQVWARNLGLPDNHYGHASSLIMYKDKVFIQYDTNKSRKLMAINANTGEQVWETQRKGKISWSSPILAEIGGKFQVILCNEPLVAGYDTETGKELWAVECLSGEVGPSAAFGGGMVFAANEYAKLVGIDPVAGKIVWSNDEFLPEVASPVCSNGLLFIATSYGALACYDAKTGTKYWSKEDGPGFYSSPVIADNKLYTFDTSGKMKVYEVGKAEKLLGEGNAGEKMTTTPVFADGKMFVRTPNFIYCVGKK